MSDDNSPREPENARTSILQWWDSQRLRYNIGLAVAGICAFIAYALALEFVVSLLEKRHGKDALHPEIEITLLTTCGQAVMYLIAMGVANLCYFLGPLSERVLRPRNVGRYRRITFALGFWFSVLLPFSIPLLTLVNGVARPELFLNVHGPAARGDDRIDVEARLAEEE